MIQVMFPEKTHKQPKNLQAGQSCLNQSQTAMKPDWPTTAGPFFCISKSKKGKEMNKKENPSTAESVTLYYRGGSSDKVYQIAIVPQGNGFAVNFAYGRRGSSLNTGSKTAASVDHGTAKAIYDKIVREKKAKGYTQGEDGTLYSHTPKELQVSGILPQLLNPIDETEATRLLHDTDWCLQEKKDGKRVLLRKQGEEVTAINRKGLVIGVSSPIIYSAGVIPENFIIDGECVDDVFHAFDLLALAEDALLTRPYQERLAMLADLLKTTEPAHIDLIETAFAAQEKSALFQTMQREKKEGVVFKRLDAPYTTGRPASGGTQLKYKFYATLSAVVEKANGKRSVGLRLWNGSGWVTAGNVTIPANHSLPPIGALTEVKYLYAYRESGCLYQPIYLGQRTDISPEDCTTTQLKFKATGEEDEP